MRKKQFKTESKKMLDMMINSIYTHDEIFLRELISNASDAIDKRSFRALTDEAARLPQGEEYEITVAADKDARTLTITDNGCGMTADELEQNLGTIARSGSLAFKQENAEHQSAADIIGQFGVGFYSAFMVSSRVTVESRAVDAESASLWQSEGADGYSIGEGTLEKTGTRITLYLKDDTENEHYGRFLESYVIRQLVKKYSDYIHWPIRMQVEKHKVKEGTGTDGNSPEYEDVVETETFNSMVPIWHKNPHDVTQEEYASFYREKFFDFEPPARVIHSRVEGAVTYETLLFLPNHPPFDYYSKDFEKGLSLYSNGVMIMEKCSDLLPDYFSFVRGLVDSSDFTLNLSRETLQHDHQLRLIAKTLEKKIKNELSKMMSSEREAYEKFFDAFGIQLKYGVYAEYGAHRDVLEDLLLFRSTNEKKYTSLKEYVARMPESQKDIYYACGESVDACAMLPQTAAVVKKGCEVLLLTDDVDEFALKVLASYDDKRFVNVCAEELDLSTEEEKTALKEENEKEKEMLGFLKESIGNDVSAMRFTNTLEEHPVCLSSEGGLSAEMEKVLKKMPGAAGEVPKAALVLEINMKHPVCGALKKAYAENREEAARCAKILYAQARLISGLGVADPTELSRLVCELMTEKLG